MSYLKFRPRLTRGQACASALRRPLQPLRAGQWTPPEGRAFHDSRTAADVRHSGSVLVREERAVTGHFRCLRRAFARLSPNDKKARRARMLGRAFCCLVGWMFIGRRPTLPHTRACSTIGAERLNYRVRDGNGWNPLATVTQTCRAASLAISSRRSRVFRDPAAGNWSRLGI